MYMINVYLTTPASLEQNIPALKYIWSLWTLRLHYLLDKPVSTCGVEYVEYVSGIK